MDIRRAEPCPYESCWHNHPELQRRGEARDPLSEPAPEPEPEAEP